MSVTEDASTHSTVTQRDGHQSKGSSDGPGGSGGRLIVLRNGLIGGVVAVLLSILPLSELLGGAVAGYLDRGGHGTRILAGVAAGLVAAVPYLLVGGYLAMATGVTLPGPEIGLSRPVLVAGATAASTVYVMGLAVLGSFVGGLVRDQRSGTGSFV